MRGGQDPGRQYTFLFIAPHVVRRCKDVLYEWVPEGGIDENSQLPALQAKLAEMQDRVQGLAVIFRVVSKYPSPDWTLQMTMSFCRQLYHRMELARQNIFLT